MAQQIFVNQTDVRINVNVSSTISGAIIHKLKYRKPDGIEGEVTLNVEDPSLGLLSWDSDPVESIFDVAGNWFFWAYIEFPSGAKINGSPDSIIVSKEGYYQ